MILNMILNTHAASTRHTHHTLTPTWMLRVVVAIQHFKITHNELMEIKISDNNQTNNYFMELSSNVMQKQLSKLIQQMLFSFFAFTQAVSHTTSTHQGAKGTRVTRETTGDGEGRWSS